MRRREQLQTERKEALGDPVRGVETPFLKSFDSVGGSTVSLNAFTTTSTDGTEITTNALLNHFVKPSELEAAIEHSRILAEPIQALKRDKVDPAAEAKERRKYEESHARASAAIARIISLANAGQKDKTRANIKRCIETFGRHKTDGVLKPRPATSHALSVDPSTLPAKTPRAGPDTGSSEVQIAIMTAKIRVLADQLAAPRGKRDKVNKRNLRLMVHKRQKLLKYLRKKERGSDRWQNLVTTLGLTEGTWKGEISL